jgi:hypothetical protein
LGMRFRTFMFGKEGAGVQIAWYRHNICQNVALPLASCHSSLL